MNCQALVCLCVWYCYVLFIVQRQTMCKQILEGVLRDSGPSFQKCLRGNPQFGIVLAGLFRHGLVKYNCYIINMCFIAHYSSHYCYCYLKLKMATPV